MAEEIRLTKKEIKKRLFSMRIQPKGLEPRNYGISIKYFNAEETIPHKRIDYNLSAVLSVNNNQGEILINKSNILYNQHEADSINEIINNSISQAIYPVKIDINEEGRTSNTILNYNEINERWKREKEKLFEKYNSETLYHFLNAVEDRLNKKEILEDSMCYDWFWNLFFHPKLIWYDDKRKRELNLYLAIIPHTNPICFKGVQKVEKIPTDYNSCVINFESKEQQAPTYFLPKNHPETSPLFMQLLVKFDIDIFHHFTMHIFANLQFYTKNSNGQKIIVKRIEFKQFQLNTAIYKTKKLSIESPFITGGLVKLLPDKWGNDDMEIFQNNW